MKVARSVAEVLSQHTTLALECIDRMYLNVYVPLLQTGAGVAYFFRKIRDRPVPSSVLMAPLTQRFVDPRLARGSSRRPLAQTTLWPPQPPVTPRRTTPRPRSPAPAPHLSSRTPRATRRHRLRGRWRSGLVRRPPAGTARAPACSAPTPAPLAWAVGSDEVEPRTSPFGPSGSRRRPPDLHGVVVGARRPPRQIQSSNAASDALANADTVSVRRRAASRFVILVPA